MVNGIRPHIAELKGADNQVSALGPETIELLS